jgi:hypothetical protein
MGVTCVSCRERPGRTQTQLQATKQAAQQASDTRQLGTRAHTLPLRRCRARAKRCAQGYAAAGQLPAARAQLRWGADYLMRAHTNSTAFVVQVRVRLWTRPAAGHGWGVRTTIARTGPDSRTAVCVCVWHTVLLLLLLLLPVMRAGG